MATLILNDSIRQQLTTCLMPAEVRDVRGNIMGRYIPDDSFVKRVNESLTASIPDLTDEQKSEAMKAFDRGEYLTGQQVRESLATARRELENRR